jgi:hypothetical protein
MSEEPEKVKLLLDLDLYKPSGEEQNSLDKRGSINRKVERVSFN